MRKHAPLAVILAVCFAATLTLWATRKSGPETRPSKVLSVDQVSIALSNYVHEHGDPKLGPDANRDLAKELVGAGFVPSEYVTEGQIIDLWGTPYAVFLCKRPGQFSDTPLVINGQTVRPVQGAGRYLVHQIISAGPDREFGTEDDLGSWQGTPE